MRLLFSIIFFCLTANLVVAQQVNPKKCMTEKIVEDELKNNSEYQLIRNNLLNYYQQNIGMHKSQATKTIPVVIHVVHRSQDGIGANTNISNAQIEDQLEILNQDYSKTNPEFPNPPRNTFLSYAGNPELEFCLATIDPNGNPTTGITRTATSKNGWDYDSESNDMKQATTGGIDNWDPLRYLNIWVVNITNSSGGGQTLGYAYLPGLQGSNSQSWLDGLVVDYQYFGTTGSASSWSDGRTTTHEIGHYLGLGHTFCESGGCCDNDVWIVDDTPATDGVYFGSVNSNTNNNTCNDLNYGFNSDLIDMDENYMSYAGNTWMFSNGQVNAMLATLNASSSQGGRKLLWQNSPITVDCGGISESWDCDAQGNCYDPGTGNGVHSSYSACVSVCACIGQSLPVSEGFQNGSSLPADWSIVNNDNDKTWEITNAVGYNSSSSIYVNNADYTVNGEIDDLVLSTLNLSSSSSVDLSFDYSYSLWTDPSSIPNYSDTLQVLVSSNCGVSFQKIWERAGTNLVTTTPVFTANPWVPSSNSDWASANINLNNYINQQEVVIKFRNITDYENNLFLDNINITGTAIAESWDCDGQGTCYDPGNGNGLYSSLNACNNACIHTSVDEETDQLYIYPNPTDRYININYNGLKEIYTLLGEKLLVTYDNQIDVSHLSNGLYLMKVENTIIRLIKE